MYTYTRTHTKYSYRSILLHSKKITGYILGTIPLTVMTKTTSNASASPSNDGRKI